MFRNIQIDLLILKTYCGQFTVTTKKSLHIIFKGAHPLGRSVPPSNTRFSEPTWVRPPNSTSTCSAIFAQLTRVPNAQTDTQTTLRATFVAGDAA